MSLSRNVLKLAKANPRLARDLLSAYQDSRTAASYEEYVKRKERKGEKPLSKPDWEAQWNPKGDAAKKMREENTPKKDEGKDKGKKAPAKKAPSVSAEVADLIGRWGGSTGTKEQQALSNVSKALKKGEMPDAAAAASAAKTISEWKSSGNFSSAEKKDFDKMLRALKSVGATPPAPAKKDEDKSESKPKSKSTKPKAKKTPALTKLLSKHSLKDGDADSVLDWKKKKPAAGKKLSDAQMLARFLAHASPETKERMKGMSPKDFMAVYNAIMEDEEGGGKQAALKLAASLPKGDPLRRDILARVKKEASFMSELLKLRDGKRTSFETLNGVHAHVWFDADVATDDFGRRAKESGEWQVIISTSPDPLNLSPRGKELARDTFRYVEGRSRNWAADEAAKFINRNLARFSRRGSDKTAALKDGPAGRVLDKYWNILHDLEYDLEKVLQEYDVAMSYRGGPGAKAARLAYEKIDMAKRAVDKVASDLFDDVFRAEDKFVKQFGEPSEYVVQQRNEMFKYGSSTIDEWSAIDFMLNGWEHYYDSTEAETIRDMTRSLDVSPAVAKDLLKAWEAVPVRERSGVMSGQRAAERVLAQVVKKHKLTFR